MKERSGTHFRKMKEGSGTHFREMKESFRTHFRKDGEFLNPLSGESVKVNVSSLKGTGQVFAVGIFGATVYVYFR